MFCHFSISDLLTCKLGLRAQKPFSTHIIPIMWTWATSIKLDCYNMSSKNVTNCYLIHNVNFGYMLKNLTTNCSNIYKTYKYNSATLWLNSLHGIQKVVINDFVAPAKSPNWRRGARQIAKLAIFCLINLNDTM